MLRFKTYVSLQTQNPFLFKLWNHLVKIELFLDRACFENFENSGIEIIFYVIFVMTFLETDMEGSQNSNLSRDTMVTPTQMNSKVNSDSKLYKNEWKANGFCWSLQKWCWLLAQWPIRASIPCQQRGMNHFKWLICNDSHSMTHIQ